MYFYADFRATPFGYPLGSTSFSYISYWRLLSSPWHFFPARWVVFSRDLHPPKKGCIQPFRRQAYHPNEMYLEGNLIPRILETFHSLNQDAPAPIPLSVPRLPDRPDASVEETRSHIFKMLQKHPVRLGWSHESYNFSC